MAPRLLLISLTLEFLCSGGAALVALHPNIVVEKTNQSSLDAVTNFQPVFSSGENRYNATVVGTTLDYQAQLHRGLYFQNKCAKDLWYTVKNLNSEWAVRMLDSYGKPPSGILLGNLLWIGKYSECTQLHVEDKITDVEFHGMYCLVQYNISAPNKIHVPMQEIPVKVGICLPDSCRAIDVKSKFKTFFDALHSLPLSKLINGNIKIASLECHSEGASFDGSARIFLAFLVIYITISLSGTFITVIQYFVKKKSNCEKTRKLQTVLNNDSTVPECDLNEEYNSYLESEEFEDEKTTVLPEQHVHFVTGVWMKCARPLKCFSLLDNASQILNTNSSKKQFLCLHGIRFISMTWVILGHTYVHNVNYIDNYMTLLKGIDNLAFQAVLQGTYSVDTFFLISGFLLAFLYLQEADKRNGKINLPWLCVHRFLRLTPAYAFLIGFSSLLLKYLGNGAFFEEADDVTTCKHYWWWNLLFINNFLPINHMCLTWTWYLSNDMQFFIISSILLFILWRWKFVGLGIFGTLLVGSWILSGYLSYAYDIPPLFLGISHVKNYTEYQGKLITAWNVLYSKPYSRIGSHIIGIFLGCIIYFNSDHKIKLNKKLKAVGWSVAAFCSLSVIYGIYLVKLGSVSLHFYNALGRSSFSLGIAWVIFSCLNEPTGLLNTFLSYKLWIPLSRLTYCAYLFHPVVMNWYFQQMEVPLFFSHTTMVFLFISFLVISYALAFIISIFFEAPIINLAKLIYHR